MGKTPVSTKAMPEEMEVETKDDAPAEAPADAAEEPVVEEKFSAQILRRVHEHHSLLMQEYDELAQMNEHEEIGKFLQGVLEGLEETMTAVEELFEKHHGDLPPLEGAMSKGEEAAEEATSEEEELPTPEEVVEGMETKNLKGKQTKTVQVAKKKDMTKDEADKIADDIKKEAADTEEKHLCAACQKDMEEAGAGLGDEEFQPVAEASEGVSPAADTNLGDEEKIKALLQPHKPAIGEASGYLKGVSESQDFGDDQRHEAFYHAKMLGKACKAFEEMDKEECEVGVTGGEKGMKNDLHGLANYLGVSEDTVKIAATRAGVTPDATGGYSAEQVDKITRWLDRMRDMMFAAGGKKDLDPGNGVAPVIPETELHPHHKAMKGAAGFLGELANTHDFGDPHREKALTWHKALDPITKEDAEAEVGEGDNPVPLGEMQEKSTDKDEKEEKTFPEMDKEEEETEITGAEKSLPANDKANGQPLNAKALADSFVKAKAEQDAQNKQMKQLQRQLALVASRLG